MNTNNTLQMDVLDILFANRNKSYGAYQLRRSYNKRLLIAVAVMILVSLLFAVAYGLDKKAHTVIPVLSTVEIELKKATVKDKPIVQPPPVKQVQIEKPVATIQVTRPVLVEEVTTPPPTVDEIEGVKIDVKTTAGVKDESVAPPVEIGTGTVQELVKKENFDVAFTAVQKEAVFYGGLEAWKRFLEQNLRSDVPTENGAAAGSYTVYVSFLVDKEGNISEVKAENDPGYGTAAEAVRVIRRGPKWIPAIQNGRNVIYRQKQSITFVVQQAQSVL